jgi:hypothetical protein
MKFAKPTLIGLGGVVLAGALLPFVAPKTVHALAATLVQITNTTSNPVPVASVIPGTPFFGRMQLSGTGAQSVGPGTGTLYITSIVVTSFDTTNVDQVNIFSALLSGGTCAGSGNVLAATDPFLIVRVQPGSTVVVPAPTPLVFAPATGYDNLPHTCLAASMPVTGGNVFVTVNGYTN